MAKKSRKQTKRISGPRASWRGSLTFGLVTFPVEAFNAFDPRGSDYHFHQIHAECHSRIHYDKVCPIHGPVPNDEIVSGYEFKKGKYVEIDPGELAGLRTESDRALRIDAFVAPDAVDPIFFDGRMYYLEPAEKASLEPYMVVLEAMQREARVGIAHLIFSGKDQIALIRPLGGVLPFALLNHQAEIRPPRKAVALRKPAAITRQVRMAQTLIEEWSQEHFDYSKYEDKHREKVRELIEAKLRGQELAAPVEEKPVKVLNLMDALKKSLETRKRRSA